MGGFSGGGANAQRFLGNSTQCRNSRTQSGEVELQGRGRFVPGEKASEEKLNAVIVLLAIFLFSVFAPLLTLRARHVTYAANSGWRSTEKSVGQRRKRRRGVLLTAPAVFPDVLSVFVSFCFCLLPLRAGPLEASWPRGHLQYGVFNTGSGNSGTGSRGPRPRPRQSNHQGGHTRTSGTMYPAIAFSWTMAPMFLRRSNHRKPPAIIPTP